MKVIKGSRGVIKSGRTVLTLGNFDGIHLGHARVLKRLVKRAAKLGLSSVVYTFDPHPLKVVAPEKSPPLLTGIDEKTRRIAAFGVDYLVLARFTRAFAALHPREFVESVLVALRVQEVWIGHDFTFGRGRSGTAELLEGLGREYGFGVTVVAAYEKGGSVISSSRIRRLIGEGRVGEAASLLGRAYSISGGVVRGAERGGALGFPTANLEVESELTPGNGVYAARARLGDADVVYGAVVNIGTAPTFGGSSRTVEVHILDFKGDIYGKKMEVSFERRLRGERAFRTQRALAERIARDVERARKILNGR